MTRTTIDIDPTILDQLRALQRSERKPMGRLVSELLATALARDAPPAPPAFIWTGHPMLARLDLEDAEAVRRAIRDP